MNATYQSNLPIWDRKSSIRSRPRRILKPEQKTEYFYPLTRQPLAIHPLVTARGEEAICFVLTHTVYKFMNDIAILETEVVNKGALMIAHDHLNINFPEFMRHDALSIIIDEAYHAYVAIDYLKQVEDLTGVRRLAIPGDTTVLLAMNYIKTKLPVKLHNLFDLIAVCIGEHVLTKDLISIGKDTNVGEFFKVIMADHVLDEGRHAIFFANTFEIVWAWMDEAAKNAIGTLLPVFMKEYLRQDIQKKYDENILIALGLTSAEVNTVINDSYVDVCNPGLNINNPVMINLITLLQRIHVLDHENTRQAFAAYKVI